MKLGLLLLLVSAGAFAQPPLPGEQPSALALLNSRAIDFEIQRLEFTKVSYVGPVFSLVTAGVTGVAGAVSMPVALLTSTALAAVVVSMLIGAGILVIVGIVWMVANIDTNRRIDDAIDRLRDAPSLPVTQSEPRLFELAAF